MKLTVIYLCSFREYDDEVSSSGSSSECGSEDEGEGGWRGHKRKRWRENESGFFDDFFESEFKKRRKVCHVGTHLVFGVNRILCFCVLYIEGNSMCCQYNSYNQVCIKLHDILYVF